MYFVRTERAATSTKREPEISWLTVRSDNGVSVRSCGHTFSYRQETMFYGLRSDLKIVTWVVGLVAWGCPVAAIVALFEIDERTVADWLQRSGIYSGAFHHQHI